MDGLTPLERELLGYVEELTLASKASAEAVAAYETRWTRETKVELDGVKLCVIGLVRSQASLIAVLDGWMANWPVGSLLQCEFPEADAAQRHRV